MFWLGCWCCNFTANFAFFANLCRDFCHFCCNFLFPLWMTDIRRSEPITVLVQNGVRTLRTQDTSDLRQFGTISSVPKCLTFCVSAEVSLGHFGTSAELSQHFMKGPKCPTDTSALVPKCLGQISGAFIFLYHFTTSRHICTIHCDLPTASRDILYIRNHTWTFTSDSLTQLRPREQFWWWWWSSRMSLKNSAEN